MLKLRGITVSTKEILLIISCVFYSSFIVAQETATEAETAASDQAAQEEAMEAEAAASDQVTEEEAKEAELAKTNQLPMEEVIVKGIRASQSAAIDIKRSSGNIVDSIVAEDIGKLPDVTITDSLQRVTGVQIKREANEGTSLNVRGMPQVLTTLNGEQFLSPWNITDVGANYADIPAGMISGVNVYKSQSSAQIAGGISGVVDLKTISPLSLEDVFTGNLRLQASQGKRSDKEIQADGTTKDRDPDYDASIFLGYKPSDRLAFTAAAFTSSTYNANYQIWQNLNLGFLDVPNGTPGDPDDIDGDGDLVNDWYLVPDNYGATSSFVTREREGGSFSVEAELGDSFTLRGDVVYTRMDQFERGVRTQFGATNAVSSYQVNNNVDPEFVQTAPSLFDTLLPGSITRPGGQITYIDDSGQSQSRTLNALLVARVLSPEFQTTSYNNINRTAAINTNWQLDYTVNDKLSLQFRYIYAEAERQNRQANLQQGKPGWLWIDVDLIPGKDPIEPFNLTVDYRGEFPAFNYDMDVSNASQLELYQGIADGYDSDAELNVFRTDAKYVFDSSLIESIDAGIRYGVREGSKTEFDYVTPTQRYPDDQRVPIALRNQLQPGNRVWQRYPDWRFFDYMDESQALRDAGLYNNGFTAADTFVYSDFGPFTGFERGVSALNPADWDNPLEFMNRLYPGTRTVNDPAYAYDVEEASPSVYTQINFGNMDASLPFSGDLGLRVIRTDRTVVRNVVPEVLDIFNSIGGVDYQQLAFVFDIETKKHSFTQTLPSLNINLFPGDDFVVRFGAATTTTRNNLDNVGSGLSLWYTQCNKYDENGVPITILDSAGNQVQDTVTCVGGGNDNGNIEIKPWEANVYNTSAEWYFADNAILGLGVFYIDVDTAVQQLQERRLFPDGDGIDRGNNANVWVTRNVKASSLSGVELGYKQPFTFLPWFLGSTGMEFNYTYSKSESNDEDVFGETLPLQSNSEQQSNLILWYDDHGLNVRVAYNWRSKEFDGFAELNTGGQPINLGRWVEPVGYLDLSVNYWLNDNVSFFLSGTNLTDENRRIYAQFEDQLQSMYVQERRISLGVALSL
jgi:TonB-dependent receptor